MENEEKKARKKFYKKWWFIVLVIFLVVGFIGSMGKSSNIQTTTTTEQTNSASAPVTQKSYQQVFTFSGNGTKKSEPFTITGDMFKIAYDCKGDTSATYCGAFVYKVGSQLPQAVMNSPKAVKDETIIYGSGQYYLDANVMGSFTMTVYDYK